MSATVNHDQLADVLRRSGATWDAAQAHGLLSGCLAVAGPDSGFDSLEIVLDGSDPAHSSRQECELLLRSLLEETHRQLEERQSEFEPLLPADDTNASLRATALGHWCEGFLHGLVTAAGDDAHRRRLATEPIADIIKDMLQITRAEASVDADDESDEQAYTELVEYVRVATQLVYEELADVRDPARTGSGPRAMH